MQTQRLLWLRSVLLMFAVAASAAPALAAALKVTNDGADSATCGAAASPCRSISQAIANASDGDTIEVGAGRYGDISGRASFGGPGDEQPQMTGLRDDFQGCMICITKAVSIFSLHGAAVTIIEGIPSTPFTANVMILHDGVTFGRAGGGFTLTGGNVNGLVLDQNSQYSSFGILLQHNVTVAGNIDLGDQNGFVFHGLTYQDIHCPDPTCAPTAKITFSGNESVSNSGSAFSVTVNAYYGGPITLENDFAHGAGTGFYIAPGSQNEVGDAYSASGVVLVGNVASHNYLGFYADAPGSLVANTAAGNAQAGFLVVPGGATFEDNSAIGNEGPGAIIQFSVDWLDTQGMHQFQKFTQNNFYGNDRNRPAIALWAANGGGIAPYNPGAGADCGILNLGAIAAVIGPTPTPAPTIHLPAAGNFWGSARGPQPNGPGDAVGGACDQNGGVTAATPAATATFAITSWPW